MTDQNPIAQRLEAIHEQWLRFRDDPASRLLIWCATHDEASLIDTFVARECDEELARTPDLFVQLSAPFHSERTHGFALAQALCTQHEQALASLPAADRPLHWRCPSIDERASDLSVLGSVLDSLRRSLVADHNSARLVVWLDPSNVHAQEAYLRWLSRLIRQTPRELRFLVVDDTAESTFAPLANTEPAGVATQTCALDLPAAFAALAAGTGDGSTGAASTGAGSAGDQLRLLQTQLAIAVGAGEVTRAEQLATSATELATAQGWPHLAATVQMTLAAGYGRALRHVDAHGAFSQAEQLAHESARDTAHRAPKTSEDDTRTHARQLCLHAKLGRAGVLLALRSYPQAAATYLDAAALAHALADARLELDGHRLASVCLALQREPARAWQTGLRGLQLALAMDAETRATSSLLYLAEHLVRISETEGAYSAHHRPLAEQLARLLGADWRAQLAGSPAHLGGVPQTKTSSL